MGTISSIMKKNKKVYSNMFRILAILAIGFLATGNTHAQSASPWMIAFPENDAVEGWEWPDGATVKLTIDNAPGLSWSGTAAETTWGDPRTFLRFDFWEDYDLQVGDVVTLTDEFGSTTSHEVQPLSILGVDMDTDVVAGTANNDAFLQVWVHGQSEPPVEPNVISGYWEANLSGIFNITYDTGGRAWVITEGGNATAVDWYVPNPHFVVFPEWEWFDGLDWPDGAFVSISVEGKPECSLERESWGYFFNGNFPEGCDIQAGDTVTFDDGTTRREHTVRNLYITDVDTVENTVRGKADEGETVYVWPHDGGFEPLQATVGESGEWQVDLDDAGYTIRQDSEGRSEIRDETKNATASDWHVTHPHFTVFPEWEFFDGLDWPNEATVSISVAGKFECSLERESWGYFFNGNFPEGCDIQADDTVIFNDGTTYLEHTVRNLAITKVNEEDNIIKGTADAGAEVYVWPHATGQEQLATTNPQGKWEADFTGIYDLMPGDGGRAEIRDEIGNSTAIDWNISLPRLISFPAVDQIFGYYWPYGSKVNLAINGKQIARATVQGSPWDPNDIMAYFDFGALHDLVAGDVVRLSARDLVLLYTVQNLTVTEVNEPDNTVSGSADPGANVVVYLFEFGDQPLYVTADDNGDWFANFEDVGLDLVPGMCGRSDIFDDSSNSTTVDWCIPNPHFTIFPAWEWFDGMEWPDGATVTITVSGKTECTLTRESWGGFFNGGFPKDCDVQVNDTVTFDDGTTNRWHTVRELAITAIDLDEDTISGTADAGATIYVWPHDGWFEPLQGVANESGLWQVDLTDVGYDLQEGATGRSEIRDEFGNATAVDWSLNPRLIVHTSDDWFRAEGFIPNTTLNFWIYETAGGDLLYQSTTAQTDSSGTVSHWVGDLMDITPGNHIVVSDGTSTRDLELEDLKFDVFDTNLGILYGTAPEPFGRTVTFGIGCWQREDLVGDTTTDNAGAWSVNLGTPVPNDFGCVFSWIFEEDGDASEARPVEIILWDE